MPDRTAADAVRSHLQQAQRLVSCATKSALSVTGHDASRQPQLLTFPRPADLAGVGLRLAIRQHFRTFEMQGVTGRQHRLIPIAYQYAILDGADQEVLSYHWHPGQRSENIQPHLHLGAGSNVRRDLREAQLPSGYVSIADAIELAIRNLGVTPLNRNWQRAISEARATR